MHREFTRAATFFISVFLFSQFLFAQSLKVSELRKTFVENSLDKYVKSGQSVIGFFEGVFQNVSTPSVLDAGFAAEYFDLEYQVNLRPHVPEPYISLNELTKDTNMLLKLHRKYYARLKTQLFARNYFQTAFIGLLHTIESIKRVQVGLPQDGYNVLTNLILEQGRLITSDQRSIVTMTDFWWDYMWAYFTNYPIDVVELGNQKLRGVWLNEKKDLFKKRIEKFLASYSLLALRKATPPIIYRDVTNQLFLRLSKNAYEIYGLREDAKALSKARISKYKYETKGGLTEEAERTKREIARDGLGTRFSRIFSEPAERFNEKNVSFLRQLGNAVFSFFYCLYSWIRYFIGFLLITFPFDAAFIVIGLIILSVEGRAQFEKELWKTSSAPSKRKKSIIFYISFSVYKIKSFFARIVNDLTFGVQMLIHSYTSDTTTRNVRIGSSLLIFGLGLFFSSARTMVEAFVAQMSV